MPVTLRDILYDLTTFVLLDAGTVIVRKYVTKRSFQILTHSPFTGMSSHQVI